MTFVTAGHGHSSVVGFRSTPVWCGYQLIFTDGVAGRRSTTSRALKIEHVSCIRTVRLEREETAVYGTKKASFIVKIFDFLFIKIIIFL
jgi:hypothetical protein